MSSKFFSIILFTSEHRSTFLISSKVFLIYLSSSVRQQTFTVRGKPFHTKNRCTQKTLDGSGTAKLHFWQPTCRVKTPDHFRFPVPMPASSQVGNVSIFSKASQTQVQIPFCNQSQSTVHVGFVAQKWWDTSATGDAGMPFLPGADPRGSRLLRLSDCYGEHPLGAGRATTEGVGHSIMGESSVDLYEGFHKWGYPKKWMVYNGKCHSNGWWLGVPPFWETPQYNKERWSILSACQPCGPEAVITARRPTPCSSSLVWGLSGLGKVCNDNRSGRFAAASRFMR